MTLKIEADSPDQYFQRVPQERQEAMTRLRTTLLEQLPSGFEETMSYGMVGYVVPHKTYPAGYHCDPKLPLPFISLASQKNFVALYHMGLYSDPKMLVWLQNSWDTNLFGKLDMGKSCIRFKKMNRIPFELLGQLASKMSPQDWIKRYETQFVKRKQM